MSKEKLRIVKVWVGGTLTYVPEVWKLKTHWFREDTWEWERFFYDKFGEYTKYGQLFSEKYKLSDPKLAKMWVSMYAERNLDTHIAWEQPEKEQLGDTDE